jgi:hypothetical protein
MELDHVTHLYVCGDAGQSIDLAAAILIQVKTVGASGNAATDGVMRIVDVNQDYGGHHHSCGDSDPNSNNFAGGGPDMPCTGAGGR